ncbi:MAG: hypothetical protein DWH73_04010 [Planctomycetota bacterium]|nr:MAG: hypothetical protein DWH73_04010 [Planctomycetota bacterium]
MDIQVLSKIIVSTYIHLIIGINKNVQCHQSASFQIVRHGGKQCSPLHDLAEWLAKRRCPSE